MVFFVVISLFMQMLGHFLPPSLVIFTAASNHPLHPLHCALSFCISLQVRQVQHMGEVPLACQTAMWRDSYGWTNLGWQHAWGLM